MFVKLLQKKGRMKGGIEGKEEVTNNRKSQVWLADHTATQKRGGELVIIFISLRYFQKQNKASQDRRRRA